MARKKVKDAAGAAFSKKDMAAFSRAKIAIADSEVGDYLNAHADLAAVVPAICAQARQEFGKDAELTLQLYRDPEIADHYLELVVRLPSYDSTIIDRLDSVADAFDAELCSAPGYFLMTTDMRSPRTKKHAV